MRKVDVFHIGPQKCATTWTWRALSQHPRIAAPSVDSIHYFDMLYANGDDWYHAFFEHARSDQLLFDPTPSYIRSSWAPSRIATENARARIMLCLRNPIDRAFSHYWHEKKKEKIEFEFEEVLRNYDLYNSWIEPGLYAEHIERYLQFFDREQFLCLRFDELARDPQQFLRRIWEFLDVEEVYDDNVIGRRVNAAGYRLTGFGRVLERGRDAVRKAANDRPVLKHRLKTVASSIERAVPFSRLLREQDEYQDGCPAELRHELVRLCEPEIRRTEELLGLDLSAWYAFDSGS